jgi:hypothetical protein
MGAKHRAGEARCANKMKFHPYSECFPLIDGQAFEDLVLDIKTNGLREKIWLFENKILDGRNRWLACKKAGVKPLTRIYSGKDPLGFVVSLNVKRRHLTESQLAMAAARIATLRHGSNQNLPKNIGEEGSDASREASSQASAAESMGISRSSVQRARQVLEKGSKALQQAVDSGEVPVKKAASVVDLPKSEQLAAATRAKAAPKDEPERDDSADDNEEARLEAIDREYSASIEKVMGADDKLAAAHTEIKRQAAEIAALKVSRDGFQNGKAEIVRLLQAEQRKTARLEKQIQKLESENERLTERIAIREAS